MRQRPLHRMQRLRHRLQERARGALGHQPPARGDAERRQAGRAQHLHGLHALHRCALRRGLPGLVLLRHCGCAGAARQGSLHRLRLLLLRLPLRAPQYPRVGNFGGRGKMDKCTYCAGGPQQDNTPVEYMQYGSNRIAEGKLPLCAEMCSTKALLAGDGDIIAGIYRERVQQRGFRLRRLGLADRLQAGADGMTRSARSASPCCWSSAAALWRSSRRLASRPARRTCSRWRPRSAPAAAAPTTASSRGSSERQPATGQPRSTAPEGIAPRPAVPVEPIVAPPPFTARGGADAGRSSGRRPAGSAWCAAWSASPTSPPAS